MLLLLLLLCIGCYYCCCVGIVIVVVIFIVISVVVCWLLLLLLILLLLLVVIILLLFLKICDWRVVCWFDSLIVREQRVTVRETNESGWCLVKYDGKSGWIPLDFIEKTDENSGNY